MKKISGLLMVLPFTATPVWSAPPTSGAYSTDPRNSWVQERLSEVMGTPNTILCFMGKLRADAMVNQDNYVALVDMKACDSESRGEDNSASTNAGSTAQVEYTKVTVNSTRASNTDPMKVKVWFQMTAGPSGQLMDMTAYAEVTESPSATNPNGVFSLSFCGVPAGQTGACTGSQGELSASGTTITFSDKNMGGTTKLTLDRSGTAGSGRVESVMTFGNQTNTKGGAFAYDASFFKRGDSNGSVCFARDEAQADVSTWRYGVYKSNGDRLELSNPSFPITASVDGKTVWGHAGFWGIFFPGDVLNSVTTVQKVEPGSNNADGTKYTVEKYNGKLYKMSKVTDTLASLKGQPIMMGLPARALDLTASQGAFDQYEITWNGNALQAMRRERNGEWTDLSGKSLLLNASTLLSEAPWQKSLMGFAQSAGGEVRIDVPTTGNFSASTPISLRTRSVVVPGSSGAPRSLACVNRCPKEGLSSTNFENQGTPYKLIGQINTEWNMMPVLLDSEIRYIFPSTGANKGLLTFGTTPVDASSSALNLSNSRYAHGLQSGPLIDIDDANSVASVRCDQNGAQNNSGGYICPNLAEDAAVYYRYETGPQPFNRYIALTNNGSAVTFDPPLSFSLTATTSKTTVKADSKLAGSTVQLQYNGFGELHGIPGTCVDMASNQPVTCGQSGNSPIRWVPAFSIKDGTELTANNQTYYVRYLDRELRFAKVSDANCSALNLPLTATLPAAPSADARDKTGTLPSAVSNVPKVIDGVVQ